MTNRRPVGEGVLDPFAGRPPTRAASEQPSLSTDQRESSPTTRAPSPQAIVGRSALFRIAFAAMEIPGFPADGALVGRVRLYQTPGPIWTQRTFVKQRPGWRLRFDKTMHAGWIAMGDDLHITLCALEVTVPVEGLSISFGEWRDECLAAVGLVTAALDDRIAQDELLEDLVVFDESRSVAIAAVDRESAIRHYRAEHRVLNPQKELFDQLADLWRHVRRSDRSRSALAT